jgi:hypothetical protein
VVNSQPTFTGTAGTRFGDSSTVAVRVYSGSGVSGSPLQTLTATRSGAGSYSLGPSPALANGTYTAQSEQDDLVGDIGLSPPVTFTVSNTPPKVILDSLGSAPLLSATPTLTGTAATGPGDSATVALAIFSGTGTQRPPVRLLTGTRSADGHFSIQVTPALADGQYTAIAGQNGPGPTGLSSPQTFRIKVDQPALTLEQPARGASVAADSLVFSGTAGNTLGDSAQVTVSLYAGPSARGHPIGTMQATRSGASWSLQWPRTLSLGFYTARATQRDDAGHTTTTAPSQFLIVPAPSPIGPSVRLSRAGLVKVAITCTRPAGQICTGTVLILTVRKFRAPHGGPAGRLRVLFAYIKIPAGRTVAVSRHVPAAVTRTLRRSKRVKVRVSVVLGSGGASSSASAVRRLVVRH